MDPFSAGHYWGIAPLLLPNPSILAIIVTGHVGTAANNALARSIANCRGYTPAVRRELADILLSTNPGNLEQVLQRVAQQRDRVGRLARTVSRAVYGGGASLATQVSQ